MIENIINKLDTNNLLDGFNDTFIKDVKIFKSSYNVKAPYIYDKSIIVVLQGEKIVSFENKSFTINKDNFLVVPSSLPLDCETSICNNKPFLAFSICINPSIIYEILEELKCFNIFNSKISNENLLTCKIIQDYEDIFIRLLNIASTKEDASVLQNNILKELYYRILLEPKGIILQKAFMKNKIELNIDNALQSIHKEYKLPLNIEELAKKVEMSIASFHTHFKRITNHSPLQYYKKFKITKAHTLLLQYKSVSNVSEILGYTSPSQLSKEYKKYYQISPSQSIRNELKNRTLR